MAILRAVSIPLLYRSRESSCIIQQHPIKSFLQFRINRQDVIGQFRIATFCRVIITSIEDDPLRHLIVWIVIQQPPQLCISQSRHRDQQLSIPILSHLRNAIRPKRATHDRLPDFIIQDGNPDYQLDRQTRKDEISKFVGEGRGDGFTLSYQPAMEHSLIFRSVKGLIIDIDITIFYCFNPTLGIVKVPENIGRPSVHVSAHPG